MEPSLAPIQRQPPMPVMPNIPQFQQQQSMPPQQANMMNNAYLSNYIQNGAMNYGSSSTSNRRQCVNMTNIKSKDDAIGDLIPRSMRDDFDVLASMNLIDDDDFLYTLFMKSPSFMNNEYTFNLISCLYREKYEELYAKYRSLEVHTTFCLAILLFNSESCLKSICNSSASNLPKAGNKINFRVMKRKGTDLSDTNNPTVEAKKINFSTMHPFLNLQFYQEHQALFNLGRLTKYCVPSEFALMFCNAYADTVSKYIKHKEKIDYAGVKGEFTRPVTVILKSRSIKDFVFTNVENLDNVEKLLAAMTGYETEVDAFGLGIKTDMQLENIATRQLTKIDQKTKFDSQYNMALIKSFACIGTESKILHIRSYIDKVYSLDSEIVDLPDKTITQIDQMIASQTPTLSKEFEDYEKLIEEKAAPPTLSANESSL